MVFLMLIFTCVSYVEGRCGVYGNLQVQEGWLSPTERLRQFLQAHYLATSRESRRYVVAYSRFADEAFGYVKIV